MGGGVGAVGDGGVRAVPPGAAGEQVIPDGHGPRPGAQLRQEMGVAALEGDHKGALIRGGHPQKGDVPGLLHLIVAGDDAHQLPAGEVLGRVRQALPGGGEVGGRDRPAVGPAGVLPEGEGIGGVAGKIGIHAVALRLSRGQNRPAVAAVGPAHQIFKEVVEKALAPRRGDLGGIQGVLGVGDDHGERAGLRGDAVRDRVRLRGGLCSAGGQQQAGQERRQQPGRRLGTLSPHRGPHLASAGTRLPSSANFTG